MALRFRKSIKIAKGIRLNVNKESFGLGVGPRGLGFSVNSKGQKSTHIGVPGTGVSFVDRSNSHTDNRKVNKVSHNNVSAQYENQTTKKSENGLLKFDDGLIVIIKVNEFGGIVYYYTDGRTITDDNLIEKIQSHPLYIRECNRIRKIAEFNKELIKKEKALSMLLLYRESPEIIYSLDDYKKSLEMIQPDEYEKKEFDKPMPSMNSVRNELYNIAVKEIHGIGADKKIKKYINDNCENLLDIRLNYWKKEKEEFDKKEEENELMENRKNEEDFIFLKEHLQNKINGKSEDICYDIDQWIQTLEFPFDLEIDYDYDEEKANIYIDIHLPDLDSLPKEDIGNNKSERNLHYKSFIFGLAIFITSNIFNLSPPVNKITTSGYIIGRDNIGNVTNDYLFSINFDRSILKTIDIINRNPFDNCMLFENRCIVKSDNSLKPIVPYDKI